ncbi:hypothetical protein THIOSC13_1910005 [uncultured Thiomicrorhabdus sp.]
MMSNKYQIPKNHVHAELIKAWVDGAVIDVKSSGTNWVSLNYNDPQWYAGKNMNNPYCDYSKAKIAELGGDDMSNCTFIG